MQVFLVSVYLDKNVVHPRSVHVSLLGALKAQEVIKATGKHATVQSMELGFEEATQEDIEEFAENALAYSTNTRS